MPIIINGGSYSAGGWWSNHLGNAEKNERVEVIGFTNLSAENIPAAFREMEALAAATRCTNYFYQANINPRADETLTPAQRDEAIDRLEKNLGFTGQPRFVVEHQKEGRTHWHVVWSRIDTDRMVAISDSLTAAIHERTARELEIRFDLERGHSVLTPNREQERPARRPKKNETFRAAETGIDPAAVKADAQACWQSADNGHSFRTALEASGDYVLARGDRRDFVIIDRAGDDHSLARRLGVKAAEMRVRMADIDPANLPSVADAKAIQAARHAGPERQVKHGALPTTSAPDPDLANGSSIKRKKKMAFEREDATDPQVQKRQIDDQQDLAARAKEQTELSERFLAGVKQAQEEGEKRKATEQWAALRVTQEGDIADARSRYLEAAGERYDIRRPYSSLSEVVGLEGAMFQREQEKLKRDAAIERDPDQRALIDLRRQIEANDYMAITSHRLSAMSRIITGNDNSEESQRQAQRAEFFAAEALDLRRQRQELQDRIWERDEAREAAAINQLVERASQYHQQRAANGVAAGQDGQGWRAVGPDEVLQPGAHVRMDMQTGQSQVLQPDAAQAPAQTRDTASLSAVENTDARQSNSAANDEISDSKAAKKAALAQMRAEIEDSIEQGHGRGHGNSR